MVGVWPWRTNSTSVGGGGVVARAMTRGQPIVGPRGPDPGGGPAGGAGRGGGAAAPARAWWPGGSRSRREKRAAFRDEDYWGRPGPGLRRPGRPGGDRRAGAGRPRRQPHGPHVHRRPVRRLPLRLPAPHRLRQPAHQHAPRRRPAPHRRVDHRARSAARRRPTSRRPPSATPAARSSSGSSRCSTLACFVPLGAFAYEGLCRILGVTPASQVRPRRRGRPRRRPLDRRQLPRQPAEHLHRQAHRTHARRRLHRARALAWP